MAERTRRRLSYANVAATLALLLAISISPVGAHVGTEVGHLWNDHLKPFLADPGAINDPNNPVDWTKLKNVPAGFADNVDNGIKGLTYGFGVEGFDPFARHTAPVRVDKSEVQARVTGTCFGINLDRSIQSISQDGTVVCNTDNANSAGKTGVKEETGLICNNGCVEGSMPLAAGKWFLTGKIVVWQIDDEEELSVECQLRTSADGMVDFTYANVLAEPQCNTCGLKYNYAQTMSMQAMVNLPENGNVSVFCEDHDTGDAQGGHLKISALKLSNFTQVNLD